MAKSFKDWTQFELIQHFGLVKKAPNQCSVLMEWLNVEETINEQAIVGELNKILEDLTEYADIWNEEELKAFFIIPLLRLVDFHHPKYKVFFERKLTATLNGIVLNGDVDMMIASGSYNNIISPFFCLQEYKPEGRRSATEARGQLLAEMLAAQTLNSNDKPVFGCYLNGRLWFFATLIGKEYCFSQGMIADEMKDLIRIFNSLNKMKHWIEERVA